MKTIKMTRGESDALIGLIDLAVKAGGLAVAANALFFLNKLNGATDFPEHVAEGGEDGKGTDTK